ncbi:serine/threonine-protein kinase 33-like [Ostrea edulis]|uniref:serine/threonine-protein kinase 33-like n=1 Tax=Ostrea edulis TaxID=37623 RepID=UPI002095A8D1|nr:serine/threonine-protein kinase 33-like [Ostrea edulis]XP_048768578.1 serine/threonine-protein kinase 33-like [Ostrea edulis]
MSRKGSADLRTIPHTRINDESWIWENYEPGEKIGQGTFGKVFKVKHKETGKYWAIKVINKEKAGGPVIKLLEREVGILKRVQHEHIISLNEVFETAKKMYLVMELCEGGELADAVKTRERISEEECKIIMTRLANAISYLHKNDIVHRDLKLENILLALNPENTDDKLYIKVTDFGLSVVKGGTGHDNMMQDFCGTPIYMSPEIIDNKTYSQNCDVWAMGVILYIMLSGSPPFKSKDEDSLYDLIKKGELDYSDEIWTTISDSAKSLLEKMMRVDPAHRLTATEMLHHPWITGNDQESTNVLELMRMFHQEQSQKTEDSAINGDLSELNMEDSESNAVKNGNARKGSGGVKKPGSGGRSGPSTSRQSSQSNSHSKPSTSTPSKISAKTHTPTNNRLSVNHRATPTPSGKGRGTRK